MSGARTPVRLITSDAELAPAASPAPEAGWSAWGIGLGGAAILLCGVAAVLAARRRRWRRLSAEERAFRALARAAGLRSERRELVRRVAAAGLPGVQPVAVLVSPSALSRACAAAEGKPGMRDTVRRVRLLLGVPASGAGADRGRRAVAARA